MSDNPIDTLMDLDPLEMTVEDIQSVIAYHRRNRAALVEGHRPKKETGPAPQKVDLADLGLKKPDEFVRRRL